MYVYFAKADNKNINILYYTWLRYLSERHPQKRYSIGNTQVVDQPPIKQSRSFKIRHQHSDWAMCGCGTSPGAYPQSSRMFQKERLEVSHTDCRRRQVNGGHWAKPWTINHLVVKRTKTTNAETTSSQCQQNIEHRQTYRWAPAVIMYYKIINNSTPLPFSQYFKLYYPPESSRTTLQSFSNLLKALLNSCAQHGVPFTKGWRMWLTS